MTKKGTTITVPILNDEYRVIVVFGDNAYLNRVAVKWGYPEGQVFLADFRRGACFYRRECHPIIAVPKKPKSPEEIATLAHEAIHAVYDILFNKLEEKTQAEEIVCHSVAAIIRKVL